MVIRFFFEYEGQVVQLPVNPEEIRMVHDGNNETEEIVKLGEINMLRTRRLRETEIECFLPSTSNAPYVLTQGEFMQPYLYRRFFDKIVADKKPCRLIVTDTWINLLVSIENAEWWLTAGDDDTHFKLELKEYKSFEAKVVKIKTASVATGSAKAKATASTPTRPKTGFAIGDTVVVNGKFTEDSYGKGRSGTFKNFTGKISKVVQDKSRPNQFHISTTDGGWQGWVSASQLTHK